jgi:hypothetical protein
MVPVCFAADENDGDEGDDDETHKVRLGVKRQQEQMSVFLGRRNVNDAPPKRLPYFEKRKLQAVLKL